MKRPIDRRSVLMAAGGAVVTAAASTVAAQSTDIRGAVRYEGGTVIPQGHIEIYLDDPAAHDSAQSRAAEMRIDSDGASKTISFLLPAIATASSPTLQIIARLERDDGWLLARGSAQLQDGSPIDITLNTAMY